MVNWTNEHGENVENIHQVYYGFFYIISYSDGTKYCGIKKIHSDREIKALASGRTREGHQYFQYRIKKRKKTLMEGVKTESNWRSYAGSYDKTYWSDSEPVERKIVQLFKTKRAMSFYEADFQFRENVLFSSKWRNSNITGKFFDNFDEDSYIFNDRRVDLRHKLKLTIAEAMLMCKEQNMELPSPKEVQLLKNTSKGELYHCNLKNKVDKRIYVADCDGNFFDVDSDTLALVLSKKEQK